uniref:Putative secreted protein n=1 Tax=Anopheles triannulatus TaxID=58253 RepID=A0A2M4B6M8_9DIPT
MPLFFLSVIISTSLPAQFSCVIIAWRHLAFYCRSFPQLKHFNVAISLCVLAPLRPLNPTLTLIPPW